MQILAESREAGEEQECQPCRATPDRKYALRAGTILHGEMA